MIITIDGPAGSGKGTIAAALAKKYKMAYFDTGMVYRAVGLQMVLDGNDLNDENKAAEIAANLTFPKMIQLIHKYVPLFSPCKKTLPTTLFLLTARLPTVLFMTDATPEQLFALKPI